MSPTPKAKMTRYIFSTPVKRPLTRVIKRSKCTQTPVQLDRRSSASLKVFQLSPRNREPERTSGLRKPEGRLRRRSVRRDEAAKGRGERTRCTEARPMIARKKMVIPSRVCSRCTCSNPFTQPHPKLIPKTDGGGGPGYAVAGPRVRVQAGATKKKKKKTKKTKNETRGEPWREASGRKIKEKK